MTAAVLAFGSGPPHPQHLMNPGAYGMPHSPPAALYSGFVGDPYSSPAMAADPYGHALFAAPAAAGGGALYAPAAAGQAGPMLLAGGVGDDIRTIFVSGLPHDVKERELHNLLRFMPGYEASQMNWKTGGPQGFALFSSGAHARAVVELMSGLQFDEGVVLRAEMAHKNMFIKPEDPSVKRANRHSPALLGPAAMMSPVAQLPGSTLSPAPLSPAGAGPAFLAAAAAAAAGAAAGSPTGMALPGGMLAPVPLRPATFQPVTNLRDNPACNTLFIGNLGDNTNEQELRALMSSQPGYRQLKLVRGPKSTTAFVEFLDVPSAMLVHDTLQGAVLSSSDRGGIRIQYSKNPFGRREPSSSPSSALGAASSHADDALAAALANGHHGSPRAGALAGAAAAGLLGGMAAGAMGGGGGVTQGMVAPGGTFIGQAGIEHVLGGDV